MPAPFLRSLLRHCCTLAGWAALAFGSSTGLAWTPGTASPNAVQGFVVDPMNRTDVLSFYHCIHAASESYSANLAWTGSVTAGVPGTTGAAFKDDVRRRINFYRALGGMPADITFDALKSSKAQAAALMFSANNAISHAPPVSWLSYTPAAAEAAAASNIALGTYGPGSVDAYMRDDGPGNQVVGHRRWLHYSRASVMGTGDVPASGSFNPANAIWVIGDFKPAPASQFVAWPNCGFVPLALMPARWSLSYPGANFGAATVVMTVGGSVVPTAIVSNVDNGYGDNSLVWQPVGLPTGVGSDVVCTVTVSGIGGAGVPASHSYSVTLFDPNRLGHTVAIAGSGTPPTAGATYTFNAVPQADAYELRVSTGSLVPWLEGAEDTPPPQIVARTTGTYPLRQALVKRTGTRAFQLVTPDFNDQSFELTRAVVPTSSSQLQFFDLGRFATTTVTLHAEVSTNGGDTWTTVFSRPGLGLDSALWDPAFNSRAVSLAAYAGQLIRIRFILRWNGASITTGTSSDFGFFIDDVTVTNATELVNTTVTTLPGTATSFALNAATADAPLAAGTRYYLRLRPNVGCRWFGDGALRNVLAQTLTGYAAWVAAQYPAVTGGPGADHDFDGISNGLEYAFGLNPIAADPASSLPLPTRTANTLGVSYLQPAGVTGVTYGAQWSPDLGEWFDLMEAGSGSTHTFSVSTVGRDRVFFRHRIVIAP